MAQIFDAASLAHHHMREHDCPVTVEVVHLTSERDCELPIEQCVEQCEHARTCDHCDTDMVLHVRKCPHVEIRVHRCPSCGFERRYGGFAH